MKNNQRQTPQGFLRGPRGQRGDTGLSAYGVWLNQGNTGTVEDFFSDLTANRPYIHLVKEEGQEGFTAHLRHDISFGEEGALIRQAGAYRALYFCPGADRFAIEKNGAVVPYSQFGAKDGSWGLAVFEVTLGELPARVRLVWSPAEESRRKKAILNLMRIGPVVAPGER